MAVLELFLRIVLTAMEGQTPEQRMKLWDFYIADLVWWREHLHIDKPKP